MENARCLPRVLARPLRDQKPKATNNRYWFDAICAVAKSFSRRWNHFVVCLSAVEFLLARQSRHGWHPELDRDALWPRVKRWSQRADETAFPPETRPTLHRQILQRGEVLRLDRNCGYSRLVVASGLLWVTGKGCWMDLLLHEREELAFSDHWPFVLQALEPTEFWFSPSWYAGTASQSHGPQISMTGSW